MDAPEQQAADVVCAHCGRALDLGSPDTTRLALLRDWEGYGGPGWEEAQEDPSREGAWGLRCVRAFCDTDHARAWVVDGHPTAADWRGRPEVDGSDLGCIVGCVVAAVVLVLLACLVILGAAEAWRIIF